MQENRRGTGQLTLTWEMAVKTRAGIVTYSFTCRLLKAFYHGWKSYPHPITKTKLTLILILTLTLPYSSN